MYVSRFAQNENRKGNDIVGRGELISGIVSSNGELEEEVNMDLDVTEDAEARALEVKAKANKAFAGKSHPFLLEDEKHR